MANNKTLFVFDLDDTLIYTTAYVIVIDKAGNKKYLTAQQYGELYDTSDMNIDFSEFDDSEKLLSEYKKPLFNVWKTLSSSYNTLLLTAREQTPMIYCWGIKNGVCMKELTNNEKALDGNYVLCVHDKNNKYVDPTLSTPVAKKTVIEKLIINNGIEHIVVFEDSTAICKEIEKIKENKNIKVDLVICQENK